MRNPKPGLIFKKQAPVRIGPAPNVVGAHEFQPAIAQDPTNIYTHPHATRTSSVYSTDSMSSNSSKETTISDIVELYTNLVNKMTISEEEGVSDIQILQPEAYRDTVAPLLKRRFSSDGPISTHTPASNSLPLLMSLSIGSQVDCSLQASYKQAPAFQDFSRNLREKRNNTVSPLSASSSKYSGQLALETVSEPSPTTSPGVRPSMSRTSLEMIDASDLEDGESASPVPNLGRVNEFQQTIKPHVADQKKQVPAHTDQEQSVRAVRAAEVRLQPLNGKLTEQTPRSHLAMQYTFPPPTKQEYRFGSHARNELRRYYKSMSADSANGTAPRASLDNTNRSVGEEVVSTLHSRERGPDIVSGNLGVTLCRPHYSLNTVGSSERRNESGKLDSDGIAGQKLSWTRKLRSHQNITMQPCPVQHRAAIPIVSRQQYGKDIEQAEEQREGRGENAQGQMAHQFGQYGLQPQLQIPPNATEPGHRRTFSSQSHDSVSSTSSQSKKNSLMAALESARHSLTQSSADKRREKIKDSIIVLGPTQLTAANATSSAKSF